MTKSPGNENCRERFTEVVFGTRRSIVVVLRDSSTNNMGLWDERRETCGSRRRFPGLRNKFALSGKDRDRNYVILEIT